MLWPLTLPTEVWVSRPVPPVMPLRSRTSQAKKVMATTTIRGLAALRKACIIALSRLQPRGCRRGRRVSVRSQNLKAPFCLAVDTPAVGHYSHVPPAAGRPSSPRSADLDYRNPMGTTEIEKLEPRYAENPQGLTFAPLAEVHRKNGDVARALELLRIGLELHPNYIPASIVLGRCHQDMGDLPAAAEAFAHVLRLDDENVIALKSLA